MGVRGKKAKDSLHKQIWEHYSKLLGEGVSKMEAREKTAKRFKVSVVTVSRVKSATIGVEPDAIEKALETKYKGCVVQAPLDDEALQFAVTEYKLNRPATQIRRILLEKGWKVPSVETLLSRIKKVLRAEPAPAPRYPIPTPAISRVNDDQPLPQTHEERRLVRILLRLLRSPDEGVQKAITQNIDQFHRIIEPESGPLGTEEKKKTGSE